MSSFDHSFDVPNPPADKPSLFGLEFDNNWEKFGFTTGVSGTLLSMVGSFYNTKSQSNLAKSQAEDVEFAATIASINSRNAAREASAAIEAGQQEKALATMGYGQAKAGAKVSAAARGVSGASVDEQQASIELAKEIDVATITQNSVRAARSRSSEAVNQENAASIGRVSAKNLRNTANSLNPYVSATTSLLGGATMIASQWVPRRRSY